MKTTLFLGILSLMIFMPISLHAQTASGTQAYVDQINGAGSIGNLNIVMSDIGYNVDKSGFVGTMFKFLGGLCKRAGPIFDFFDSEVGSGGDLYGDARANSKGCNAAHDKIWNAYLAKKAQLEK